MNWEEYVKEELAYYEEHPEYVDPIEAHSNGEVGLDIEYSCSS